MKVGAAAQRALAVGLTAAAIAGTLATMGRVSVLLCAAMAASCCSVWQRGAAGVEYRSP